MLQALHDEVVGALGRSRRGHPGDRAATALTHVIGPETRPARSTSPPAERLASEADEG